ncbi:MAG: bifunctional methylenetetrahydrofolate dehydrogenase/methenyltetrahydrofolate cyclohydrolase FolD [Deltaproteobacteria bacterium]|nr:bifunctional methylenetetrahydrofolate dehydrogenase/methenyltetrahydrofolate cyclohydrolase FolD [Deltaproteobacteria bacterium]
MPGSNYKLLDGKWLAAQEHAAVQMEVQRLQAMYGRPPGLGVILVGDNPASQVYVRAKERVARKCCGFRSFNRKLTERASEREVEDTICAFNLDPAVDGILLQLPLPKHLDAAALLDLIDPTKDVDGLHPLNQGLLARGAGDLRPCTPLGVIKLIDLAFSELRPNAQTAAAELPCADLSGKRAAVLGRSILVGKPTALLLLERNATVTQAHSKSPDLSKICREADIVVAAVGVPRFVKREWLKPGAVVIDVGINRLPSGALTGDVDFERAAEICAAITPVPGGVGPMTIAMLMFNTLRAYKKRLDRNSSAGVGVRY